MIYPPNTQLARLKKKCSFPSDAHDWLTWDISLQKGDVVMFLNETVEVDFLRVKIAYHLMLSRLGPCWFRGDYFDLFEELDS